MKVLLAITFVCLAASQSYGMARRGMGYQGDKYMYVADIGTDVDVVAYAPDSKEVVKIKSFDDALEDQNFTRSEALYSFNTTSPVFAVKGNRGPCFVGDTALTYDAVIAELETRNDTTVTISQTETWNATSGALEDAERDALFAEVPGLGRFCGDKVVFVETATPGVSTDGTREFTVLTFDSQATFIIPERQNNGGRPGGSGGPGGHGGPKGPNGPGGP